MKSKIMLLFMLLSVLVLGNNNPNKWKDVKNENGIIISNREVPGVELKEFKAEAYIQADIEIIMDIFHDVKNSSKWVENVDEMKLVKKNSKDDYYTYSLTKAPWPVSDRWVVIHNIVSKDEQYGGIVIAQKELPSKEFNKEGIVVEIKDGHLEVPKVRSEWVFTPLSGGMVRIDYSVSSDPGGDIPAWIINMASVSQPYKTISRLKNQSEERQVQNDKLNLKKNEEVVIN